MKRSAFIILFICFYSIAFSQSDVEKEIMIILDQMIIQYENHNIDFFKELYHPDLIFTVGNGKVFSKDEMISLIKADSLSPNITSNSEIKIIHRDNFAYVNLIETFPKDEKYDEMSGRYSKVFIKENGKWCLIAEHYCWIR